MKPFAQYLKYAQERWVEVFADPPNAIDLYHGDPLIPPHNSLKDAINEIGEKTIYWNPLELDYEKHITKKAENQNFIALHPYRSPNLSVQALVYAATRKFRENGIPINTNQNEITVGVGVTQLAASLFYTLVKRGYKILMPAPTYSAFFLTSELISHPSQSLITVLPPDKHNGYKVTANQIENGIRQNPDAKVIFLVNPVNPTGQVIAKDELINIGRLAIEKNMIVIADEIYDRMVLDETTFTSIASISIDGVRMHDRTVTLNGVSKCYGLAKLRIGFACASFELKQRLHLASFIWMNTAAPDEVAQIIAAHVLEKTPMEYHQYVNSVYQLHRDIVITQIKELNSKINQICETTDLLYVCANKPQSGFFILIQFLGFKCIFHNDYALSSYLASQGVGLLAGSVFGFDEEEMILRLTYSTAKDELQKGLRIITEVIVETANKNLDKILRGNISYLINPVLLY